jgi:hypothetical protein
VIPKLETLLDKGSPAQEMATEIRDLTETLHRTATEAAESAHDLVAELQGDGPLTPLLDALVRAATPLSETYTLAESAPSKGEFKLPERVQTTTIPFRRAMVSLMETTTSRGLLECVREEAVRADELSGLLTEFERMVPFNRELALGDLALLAGEEVPQEVADLLSEMLLGAFKRSHTRLLAHQQAHRTDSEAFLSRLESITIAGIESFREELTSGDLKRMTDRLKQEGSLKSGWISSPEGLIGWVRGGLHWLTDSAAALIGPSRLVRWRDDLGLGESPPQQALTVSDFQAENGRDRCPVVYRRLFSDRALEAGDLLSGRQDNFQATLDCLKAPSKARSRCVALVGPQGVGKRAIVAAVSRKFASVHLLSADDPCTVEQIREWARCDGTEQLFVIPQLHWLLSFPPDGESPIGALIDIILADRGRSAFLFVADSPNWDLTVALTALEHTVTYVSWVHPLGVDDLTEALLTRHQMSGYSLSFPQTTRLPRFLRRWWPLSSETAAHQQTAWFTELHKRSGGLMQDAMVHWLNAIEGFDETAGQVTMGHPAGSLLPAIERLPDALLLTLRLLMRQGWMRVESHAESFGQPPAQSSAMLSKLVHLGLVTDNNGVFAVSDHHAGALSQHLKTLGWIK